MTLLIVIFTQFWQHHVSVKCLDNIDCINIDSEKPIKIGVIQSLTGGTSSFGIEQLRGVELAAAARNNRLLGHQIKLYVENDLCSLEGGINAALKISTIPDMTAIIGTTCSDSAAAASPIISEAGLVMISGSNIAPSLTSIKGKSGIHHYPGYYRTVYNGALIGQTAADFAVYELGITRAATIDDTGEYTRGLTDSFKQAFQSSQGRQIVFSGSVHKGDTDMFPILNAVKNSGAEFVFFPVYYPEGSLIISHASRMPDLKNVQFMSANALITESFINHTGSSGIGVYFASSASPKTKAHENLSDLYEKKYGSKPVTSNISYAYDAASLLFYAVEKASVKKIDGSLVIGKNAVRQALNSIKNFKGVTGSISCDQYGDCGTASINILRLDNPEAGIKGLVSNIIKTYSVKQ